MTCCRHTNYIHSGYISRARIFNWGSSSYVRHAISQPLVEQFVRNWVHFWFDPSSKAHQNFWHNGQPGLEKWCFWRNFWSIKRPTSIKDPSSGPMVASNLAVQCHRCHATNERRRQTMSPLPPSLPPSLFNRAVSDTSTYWVCESTDILLILTV